MIKISQFIIIALIALNVTALTIFIQMDWFNFGTTTVKVIAWLVTIALWRIAYMRRDKFITLF